MESIIVPVLPFPEPQNEAEAQINENVADCYYKGPNADRNQAFGFIQHPELKGAVYVVSGGWTTGGFRHNVTLLKGTGFIDMFKAMEDFFIDYIGYWASMVEVLKGFVPEKRMNDDCGDSTCLVHGGGEDPISTARRLLKGIERDQSL